MCPGRTNRLAQRNDRCRGSIPGKGRLPHQALGSTLPRPWFDATEGALSVPPSALRSPDRLVLVAESRASVMSALRVELLAVSTEAQVWELALVAHRLERARDDTSLRPGSVSSVMLGRPSEEPSDLVLTALVAPKPQLAGHLKV